MNKSMRKNIDLKYIKRAFALCMIMVTLVSCNSGNNTSQTNQNTKEPSATAEQAIPVAEYEYKQDLNVIEDKYRTYYEVFLYSFCDSDGDGIGDIKGLISKLDYINDGNPETETDLGCNGIWLMPIMPSTTYHKYDVIDYYGIDKEYGSIEDFKTLIKECDKRGIKVIVDLVLNHTSTQNKWFVEATKYLSSLKSGEKPSKADCKYIDYYNFSKEEDANYYQVGDTDWYYEAVFWDQMPDLNLGNKKLRKEVEKIVDYWLDLGVGGFRLDAAKEYYSGEHEENTEVLAWLNQYVEKKDKDAYMVAEVWESINVYKKYYASGIDSVFSFAFSQQDGIISKTLNMDGSSNSGKSFATAMKSAQSIIKDVDQDAIDAPFFTNHDTGRAAGYFSYDSSKTKMAWAMNLFMSGSAFLYYGEELGMSGNGKDENKRAPMYWSETNKEGMTSGPKDMETVEHKFGALDEQEKDALSIYNFVKRAIRIRNENPEIARGAVEVIEEVADEDICAITKTYEDSQIVMLYNLSAEEKVVTLDQSKYNYEGLRGYLSVNGAAVTLSKGAVTLPPYSIVVLK